MYHDTISRRACTGSQTIGPSPVGDGVPPRRVQPAVEPASRSQTSSAVKGVDVAGRTIATWRKRIGSNPKWATAAPNDDAATTCTQPVAACHSHTAPIAAPTRCPTTTTSRTPS